MTNRPLRIRQTGSKYGDHDFKRRPCINLLFSATQIPGAAIGQEVDGARRLRLASYDAESSKQSTKVNYLGYVREIAARFARTTTAVLRSACASFPSVLVESIAPCTPIVSLVRGAGPREKKEYGPNGCVVPRSFPQRMAEIVARRVSASPNPETMPPNLARFSLDRMVGGYEELLCG